MNIQFWHVDNNPDTNVLNRATLFSAEDKGAAATVYNCGPDPVLVFVVDKEGNEDSYDVGPFASIELTGAFRLAVQPSKDSHDCRGVFVVGRES